MSVDINRLLFSTLTSRNPPFLNVDIDVNPSRLTCAGRLGLLGHFPRANTLGSGFILGVESSVVFSLEIGPSATSDFCLTKLGFKFGSLGGMELDGNLGDMELDAGLGGMELNGSLEGIGFLMSF